MTDWSEAIRRYKKHNPQIIQAEADRKILGISNELNTFLNTGDGVFATELLEVSGRYIRLAETAHDGCASVYILNQDGCVRSDERSGISAAYSNEKQEPVMTPMDIPSFIRGIADCETKYTELEHLISFIRTELSKIAAEAPKD